MFINEKKETTRTVNLVGGKSYEMGNMFDGSEDPTQKFTLTSDAPGIVRVEDDGSLTAVGIGTANVTLKATIDGREYSKTVNVTVPSTPILLILNINSQ